MNEKTSLKFFAARIQARITTQLLALFGGLMFALLIIAVLPFAHVDEKLLAILDRIITAMLPIVGTAVGFWMARHRDTNGNETDTTPMSPQPGAGEKTT